MDFGPIIVTVIVCAFAIWLADKLARFIIKVLSAMFDEWLG